MRVKSIKTVLRADKELLLNLRTNIVVTFSMILLKEQVRQGNLVLNTQNVGVLTLSTGNHYEGEFKDGVLNGKCTYYWTNERGQFLANELRENGNDKAVKWISRMPNAAFY